MKTKFLIPICRRRGVGGLLLGTVFFCSAFANAEELLKNGDFESPFPLSDPTAGWALVYVDCNRGDFSIVGHTTEASRTSGGRGAHIRAAHYAPAHAYFTQVVTNLTEGASYTLTSQRMRAGFQNYVDNGKLFVYMSAVSGSTSNSVFGNATANGPYSLTITCSPTRQIEVQLHMEKLLFAPDISEDFKSSKCTGWFDDFSLKLTP